MEINEVKKIVEALLFVADMPVTAGTLKSVLGDLAQGIDTEQLVQEIEEEYRRRNGPIELRFIGGGWQLSTRKEFNPWIRKLYREKTTLRLSNSALETLSVIAYKQPITRSEIEEIRGVEVSGVLETILERKLIKIVGRKETIGRPLLYGTTQEFLRHFGLGHLSELPSLEEMAPAGEKEGGTEAANMPELPLNDTSLQSAAESAGESVASDGNGEAAVLQEETCRDDGRGEAPAEKNSESPLPEMQ